MPVPPSDSPPRVAWSLAACARQHRVTIREIARHMGITLKRVREVRATTTVREITAWEFTHAIRAIARARNMPPSP